MQQPSPGDLIVISDLAFVKIFPAKDIFQSGQNLESDDHNSEDGSKKIFLSLHGFSRSEPEHKN